MTSPDGRELQRVTCPHCDHTAVLAIWCQDPRCCDQDPGRFIAALAAAEQARRLPVFAVRHHDPADPEGQVTIWRAGDRTPVFAGPAAAAILFVMRHPCRAS